MTPNASRRKVLIVEDEPAIRNVLYVLLAGLWMRWQYSLRRPTRHGDDPPGSI